MSELFHELSYLDLDKFNLCHNCKCYVETSYRCTSGDDFYLCTACKEKNDQLYYTEELGSYLESGSSVANPEEAPTSMYIQPMGHEYQCSDTNCQQENCQQIQQLTNHIAVCLKEKNSNCLTCKQLITDSYSFAEHCQKAESPIPFCSNIEQKEQQKRQQHSPLLGNTEDKQNVQIQQQLFQGQSEMKTSMMSHDATSIPPQMPQLISMNEWTSWNTGDKQNVQIQQQQFQGQSEMKTSMMSHDATSVPVQMPNAYDMQSISNDEWTSWNTGDKQDVQIQQQQFQGQSEMKTSMMSHDATSVPVQMPNAYDMQSISDDEWTSWNTGDKQNVQIQQQQFQGQSEIKTSMMSHDATSVPVQMPNAYDMQSISLDEWASWDKQNVQIQQQQFQGQSEMKMPMMSHDATSISEQMPNAYDMQSISMDEWASWNTGDKQNVQIQQQQLQGQSEMKTSMMSHDATSVRVQMPNAYDMQSIPMDEWTSWYYRNTTGNEQNVQIQQQQLQDQSEIGTSNAAARSQMQQQAFEPGSLNDPNLTHGLDDVLVSFLQVQLSMPRRQVEDVEWSNSSQTQWVLQQVVKILYGGAKKSNKKYKMRAFSKASSRNNSNGSKQRHSTRDRYQTWNF